MFTWKANCWQKECTCFLRILGWREGTVPSPCQFSGVLQLQHPHRAPCMYSQTKPGEKEARGGAPYCPLQPLDRRVEPGVPRDWRKQPPIAPRGGLVRILGKIPPPKGLSSPTQAAQGSGGVPTPEGFKRCVDVARGDMGQWRPWQCWGNGWTQQSQRTFPI